MVMVLFGIIYDGATANWQSATFLFFVSLAGINIIAGIIHFDFYALICGIVYFLFIPRIEFSMVKNPYCGPYKMDHTLIVIVFIFKLEK